MDDILKIIIQVISPFIGAALGVYLVPYIEKRKSTQVIDELLKCYKEELNDISVQSSKAAKDLYRSHLALEKYNRGEIDAVEFSGFTKIDTHFLDATLEKAYTILSFDERKALKALKILINEYNTSSSIILARILEHRCDLSFKKALFYSADIYWICSRLSTASVFKYATDHSNDNEREKAFDALGISSI